MAKFRKKPMVVEAQQYRTHHEPPPGVWLEDNPFTGDKDAFVTTAHGVKTPVALYDWVIAEPDGRGYYPCKEDIFRATYEPAE